MKSKKSDFSMTFYYGGHRVLYLRYVNNTDYAINWVNSKGILWDTSVIYHRRYNERLAVLTNPDAQPEYSLTFFNKETKMRVLFLERVPHVENAIGWALSNGFQFHYVNVYNRLTRAFLRRVYM